MKIIIAAALPLLACGGSDSSGTGAAQEAIGSTEHEQASAMDEEALADTGTSEDSPASSVVGTAGGGPETAEAVQVDGVWVFTAPIVGGHAAELTGEAQIVNGCLQIGSSIVVWPVSEIAKANAAVAAALAGEKMEIQVGGSQLRSDGVPTEIPAVTEHCQMPELGIWWMAPSP